MPTNQDIAVSLGRLRFNVRVKRIESSIVVPFFITPPESLDEGSCWVILDCNGERVGGFGEKPKEWAHSDDFMHTLHNAARYFRSSSA